MNEEEMKAKITELEGQVTTLTTEKTDLATKVTTLETTVGTKDKEIVKLNERAREQGDNFKKLRDMTKAEKELLSEKELEFQTRQEALEEQAQKVADDQAAFLKGQRESLVKSLVNRYARGDAEVAKKIEFNLSKLSGSAEAITEEALKPFVQDSFNMIGSSNLPDNLREAHNTDGAPQQFNSSQKEGEGFAESARGKELSTALFGKEVVQE